MALPNDLSWLANLPGQSIVNPNATGNTGQTLSGRTAASSTDDELLSQLSKIKQYDPNASIVPTGEDNKFFDVSYDQSKLPAMPKSPDGQLWARPTDFASQFQKQMDTGGGSPAIYHSVIDPSKNIDSPYGTLTPGSNVTTKHVATKPGLLDTLGPMAVGLAAGGLPSLFSGLTEAGAGLGGALGASAATDVGTGGMFSGALNSAAMQAPKIAASSSPGTNALSSLEGKIPGWIFNLLKGS
jgi:hypothetical protein